MKIFIFLLLLCLQPLHAGSKKAQEIEAIYILKNQSDCPDSKGVVSDILNKENREKISTFLGKKISKETLEDLRKEVLLALENQGDYFLSVDYPKQDVSCKTIRLHVSNAVVEKVNIEGNRWKATRLYEKEFALAQGQTFNSSELLNKVAWSNRNPFRHTELVVGPGSSKNQVNVDFIVSDRWAFRPFAGVDNTGTNLTEQTRLYAGISWGLPFERPDFLTYQYTAAPNPHRFYAHTASYQMFLPWYHELTFYGGFSSTHPEISNFNQEGISVQTSLRYAIPLGPLYEKKKQTLTCGLDYKNINSNVFFIEAPETPIIAHQANISQLFLGYSYDNQLKVDAEFFLSPARWLPNQDKERYDQLRLHSDVYYAYVNWALGDTYGNRYTFDWLFRGQLATGPLLPSEQFALGGYDTVRGYLERDFLADDAICLNGEFRFPKLSFFKRDEFVGLCFTDFGYGHNYQAEQSSQSNQVLASLGAGLRYRIIPYLSFRADYGIQLHHILGHNSVGRLHFSCSASY